MGDNEPDCLYKLYARISAKTSARFVSASGGATSFGTRCTVLTVPRSCARPAGLPHWHKQGMSRPRIAYPNGRIEEKQLLNGNVHVARCSAPDIVEIPQERSLHRESGQFVGACAMDNVEAAPKSGRRLVGQPLLYAISCFASLGVFLVRGRVILSNASR